MSKKRTQSDYTAEMMKRADDFKPIFVSSDPSFSNRQAIADVLPEGSTFGPSMNRSANQGLFSGGYQGQSGGGGRSLYHAQKPYLPDIETPDRQQYPEDRILANYYWRLFHKYDPIFGNAIDMYSDMLFSDYDIEIKEDSSREIKDTVELMCEKCSFLERMKQMNKEYLVIGEAFPHNFFDDDLNIWTYIAIHNPDYIDVKNSYMINADPIILFVPDEGTRDLLNDNSPESLEFRRKLPTEFVSKVMARQKIKLSSVSCSHIARKLHHYDERGTSMASRMWRIFMVEDAVYKSTIATYRRQASPLKVVKLGDPATHWMPSPGTEGKLMEMITRAEMDPNCFVPETKVTLSDGTMTNIGSLEIGNNLIDKDGNICRVEVLQEEESNNIIELEILGSENIKCTPNHKWPIWGAPRHYKHKDSRAPSRVKKLIDEKDWNPYQKVTADQLCVSDYLMIPRYYKEKDPGDVCEDKARLLGYYAAEGNVKNIYERQDGSTRTGFVLSFNINEIERFVDDSCKIIEKLCGFEPWLWKDYDGNVCQVNALRNDSNNLALWLAEHAGTAAKTKRLSQQVMSWPLHLKREFIKGYLAGDGSSISKNNDPKLRYIEVGSASRDLMDQVKLITAQLGGYASYSNRKQREGSYAPGNEFHRLHIYSKLASDLSNEIWDNDARLPKNNSNNGCWCDDEYVYVKITGIKQTSYDEPQKVINMTVSGDHSYCVHHFGTRNSWICWNYGIQFEAWGTSERSISIKGENDTIEKIKLMALGLSKSFMSGEVSYASVKGGLQVFLRRLLSLRQHFENAWVNPRFFRPISIINKWEKPVPSEVAHKYRVKRTAQEIEEENRYIIPKIKWNNSLDSKVDNDLLMAYQSLEKFGLKISKGTVASAGGGLDWEYEYRTSLEEFKKEQEIKEQVLGKTKAKAYDQEQQKPASGGKPPTPAAPGGKPPTPAAPGGKSDSNPPGSSNDPGDKGPLSDTVDAPGGEMDID